MEKLNIKKSEHEINEKLLFFYLNKRVRRVFLYKRFISQRFDGNCHHFQVNKQNLKANFFK